MSFPSLRIEAPMVLAFLVAQMVKTPPAVQETWVQSLGREDPLEKEWLPTPVFLPGTSHGQRSLVGYSPWGGKESDTTEVTLTHSHTHTCVQTRVYVHAHTRTHTLRCLRAAAFYFARCCDILGSSGTSFSITAEQCLSLYLSWNTHKTPEKKDSMSSFNK